jgi:hypothetical protein
MKPPKLRSKPMLGSSPEIQIIINESTSGYTYPTLTLTCIQIFGLKPYLGHVLISDPSSTPELNDH